MSATDTDEQKWISVYEKMLACYAEDAPLLMRMAKDLFHVENGKSPAITLSKDDGSTLVQVPLQVLLRLNTLLVSVGTGLFETVGDEDLERATAVVQSAFSLTLAPAASERSMILVDAIFHPDIAAAVKANLRAQDVTISDALTAVGQADTNKENDNG